MKRKAQTSNITFEKEVIDYADRRINSRDDREQPAV